MRRRLQRNMQKKPHMPRMQQNTNKTKKQGSETRMKWYETLLLLFFGYLIFKKMLAKNPKIETKIKETLKKIKE